MTWRSTFLPALALAALSVSARPDGVAAKPRFVYGGDADFAPYDFLDAEGRPSGFSVELVRAVARDAGVEVEIRLGSWERARADFDAGRVDLISLSHSEERAESYLWLGQTWTMHQCVLFPAGRPSYPRSLYELAGETIAVQERSAVAEMLSGLPIPRPTVITVPGQADTLPLLEKGIATGVGGNSLTLRRAAAEKGVYTLVEMPLRAVPYGLMARKGREAELAWVANSLSRLRAGGAIDALAEKFLAVPSPVRSWRRVAFVASCLAGVVAVLLAGAFFWNRALRERVRRQTQELEATLAQREELARSLAAGEERYRTFLALSSEGIARFDLDEPLAIDRPQDEQVEHILRTARLAEANDALRRMLRRPPGESVLGLRLSDLTSADLRDGLREFVGNGYRLVGKESLRVRRGGSALWLSANVMGLVEGAFLKALWLTQHEITDRKQAEEALRASEKKYRDIVDFSPIGFYQALPEGTVLTANLAFARMLGCDSIEEVRTLNLDRDVFDDPQERARLIEHYRNVSLVAKTEVRFKRRDGAPFWAEAASHRILGPAGETLSFEVFVQDVSARKAAEEALISSEERYRLLFDGNPLPMLVSDLDTMRLLAVNEAAVRQYGYSRDELLTLSIPDLAVPGAELDAYLSTRFDPRPDLLHVGHRQQRRRDGTVIDVDMTSLAITFAGRAARMALARDVTLERQAAAERERLQAAIEHAAAEWQRTFDALDTCVLVLDGEGHLMRINRASRDLLGESYAEVLGRLVGDLGPDEPWRTAAQVVAALERSEAPVAAQATDPASKRSWDLTAYRAAGSPVGGERTILVVRDITRLVTLQESLRRSQTMSAMGSLVAGVAHEVRNPLFSISATVDALEAELGGRQEYVEYSGLLRSQVARLTQLMHDLLDYGKPPALRPVAVHPREILRRASRSCAALARERQVVVAEEVCAGVPQVEMDASRMEQVVENLVANAIQHSTAGASVHVTVRLTEGQEGRVDLSVEDSGPGLEPADIPHLLEPFFSRRKGGTGLGLSIVQRIVEAHGGTVAADNRPSGGAVFTVRLPVTQPARPEASHG